MWLWGTNDNAGDRKSAGMLDWKMRLQIALNVAQGNNQLFCLHGLTCLNLEDVLNYNG